MFDKRGAHLIKSGHILRINITCGEHMHREVIHDYSARGRLDSKGAVGFVFTLRL